MAGAEVNHAVTAGMQRAAQVIAEAGEMPWDMARDYLEGLGYTSVLFMRTVFGDDHAREWLQRALADFDQVPTLLVRRPS